MVGKKGLRAVFRPNLVSVAVASCFVSSTALANPTGPTVVHGTAAIHQAGNLLQVTNTPNAIINWQSFSIGASEITRFIQQSQASAVLNRVIGAGGAIDPSVILGALQSNGRVFLINPSGILFGAGAQIDVAGLVASSLNLSDADFLANRMRFTDLPGAGSVVNQGNINTGSGGGVYLVGPAVANEGIITSPQGEVILAAGNSVELVEPGTPNLRVEISAPDNEARNLGQIVADSGRVGIYAGLINNSGTIRADSAVAEGGRIVLKATKNVTLESSSILDASGAGGGTIEVLAKNGGEVKVDGRLGASAPVSGDGGFIETSADKVTIADGTVVRTEAPHGKSGTWLIDPNDFKIDAGGNITGATLSNNLAYGGDIVIDTLSQGTGGGNGDIFVNEAVSWFSSSTLNLLAERNVEINQSITSTGGGSLKVAAGWDGASTNSPVVNPGTGTVTVNAPISMSSAFSGFQTIALLAGGNITVNSTVSVQTANNSSFVSGPFSTLADSAPARVDIVSAGGAIDITAAGSVSAVTGNAGTASSYGGSFTASAIASSAFLTVSAANGLNIDGTVTAQGGYGGSATADANASTTGGSAFVTLSGGSGPVTIGGAINAYGGTAGTANSAYGGAIGFGGMTDIIVSGIGNVELKPTGTITAIAGSGGTTSAGSAAAVGYGGEAIVELISTGGTVAVGGSIVSKGGNGGSANGTGGGECGASNGFLGSACAQGSMGEIFIYGATAANVNGALQAVGGNGGFASGTSHTADGGEGNLVVASAGLISIASNLTSTGGTGGTGGAPRKGGEGAILLANLASLDCEGECTPIAAGSVQISGNMTATGGAGSGAGPGAEGGDAFIGVLAADMTQTAGNIFAQGGTGPDKGGAAVIGASTSGDITLSGGSIAANGAGTTPSVLALAAGNNVVLAGGSVTTAGGMEASGWLLELDFPPPFPSGMPGNFSGIGIEAGNQIIGGSAVLDASTTQSIMLTASNGIGSEFSPVRFANGSEVTGPDICCLQNLGSTGDISVSFVSGNVDINEDIYGLYNANPSGTFYINVEAGDFTLNAPFMPSQSLDGSDATQLNGQNLVVNASGTVTLTPGAHIEMTSGTTTLNGSSITQGSGGSESGSVIGWLNAHTNGGNIALAQDSSYLLGSVTTNGGAIMVTSNLGGITMPDQLNAGTGAVTLIAPMGAVFGTGLSPDIIGGSLSITAASIDGGGGLHIAVPTVNSLVANNGLLNVLSFGNVTLNGPVSATSSLNVTSIFGSDITVSGSGVISSGAGPLTLSSGRDLISSGGSFGSSSGSINLIAANDLLINGGGVSSSSGIVNLVGTRDLTSTGANFVSSAGSVGLIAGQNLTMSGGGVNAGTVGLSAGGNVNVASGTIDGTQVGMAAGGGVNITGGSAVNATGDVVLVGGTVSVIGSSAVAGNLMTVDAGTLTVGPGGALLKGFDVAITADTAVNLVSEANIEAISASSIDINFPLLSSGGIFVNEVEQIFDPATPETGFVVDGQMVTSLPFPGFNVTFGTAADSLPPSVQQAVDQTISAIVQTTETITTEEEEKVTTASTEETNSVDGDEDKKSLPVCN